MGWNDDTSTPNFRSAHLGLILSWWSLSFLSFSNQQWLQYYFSSSLAWFKSVLMINAQRLFSLRSLLDECIINAQIFSTIGRKEVVFLCTTFRGLIDVWFRFLLVSTRKRNDNNMLKYKTVSLWLASWGPSGISRSFRLLKVAPIMYFWCSCMCLQYRHLTDTVCDLTLVSRSGEFKNPTHKVQVFNSGPKNKFQYATNYYAWQKFIFFVLFLNGGLCFVRKKLCKKRKQRCQWKEELKRASAL